MKATDEAGKQCELTSSFRGYQRKNLHAQSWRLCTADQAAALLWKRTRQMEKNHLQTLRTRYQILSWPGLLHSRG